MLKETVRRLCKGLNLEYASVMAFIEVESSGEGFGKDGRLLIQFEPIWFRRNEPFAPSGRWSANGVERQNEEWKAFEDASKISVDSAMKSTSIGLGQILGLHYERLGYSTVADMWKDAERGIAEQVKQLVMFLITDKNLLRAIKDRDWTRVATIYNGTKFREIAIKYKRVPYDTAMENAYLRYSL